MSLKDTRKNLKITPKLDDELRFLSKATGKSRIQILSEYLDSMVLCASSYRNFIYFVHIHSPEYIEIRFFGKSKLISGAFKVTSPEQVAEFERNMVNEAVENATVEKSMSFNNIAKRLSKTNYKPKEVK